MDKVKARGRAFPTTNAERSPPGACDGRAHAKKNGSDLLELTPTDTCDDGQNRFLASPHVASPGFTCQ